jgi:hypothetical protein
MRSSRARVRLADMIEPAGNADVHESLVSSARCNLVCANLVCAGFSAPTMAAGHRGTAMAHK